MSYNPTKPIQNFFKNPLAVAVSVFFGSCLFICLCCCVSIFGIIIIESLSGDDEFDSNPYSPSATAPDDLLTSNGIAPEEATITASFGTPIEYGAESIIITVQEPEVSIARSDEIIFAVELKNIGGKNYIHTDYDFNLISSDSNYSEFDLELGVSGNTIEILNPGETSIRELTFSARQDFGLNDIKIVYSQFNSEENRTEAVVFGAS